MEWQPMDAAPDGDYRVEIDIWDRYGRITDCFWNKDGWYYSECDSWGCTRVKINNPKF